MDEQDRPSGRRVGAAQESERSFARTVAFSDGVFAVAITLLVLNIEVPDLPESLAPDRLAHELSNLSSSFVSYGIAFAVIGAFWISHHRFFDRLRGFDDALVVANLVFLGFVVLMPFTTALLGRYSSASIAVITYSINVAIVCALSTGMVVLATRRDLLADVDRERVRESALGAAMAGLVFLATIPIALVIPSQTPWFWLAIPLLGRLYSIIRELRR